MQNTSVLGELLPQLMLLMSVFSEEYNYIPQVHTPENVIIKAEMGKSRL